MTRKPTAIAALLCLIGVGLVASGSSISGGSRSSTVDTKDPTHVSGVTLSRQLLVSDPQRTWGYTFFGTSINAYILTTVASGTGAPTTALGRTTLSTGATANSKIEVIATKPTRLVTGFDNVYSFGVKVPAGVTNNTRAWGVRSDNDATFGARQNGVYWKLADSTWSVCYMQQTSETCVASTSWTGYGATTCQGYVAAASAVNFTYSIQHYPTVASFDINGAPCHTLTSLVGTGSLTQAGDFHPFIANENSGGLAQNVTIDATSIFTQRHGALDRISDTANRFSANGTYTLKSQPGHLPRIIINSKGNTSNSVTVYDSTAGSGTILAVLDTTQVGATFDYDIDFDNGLTIVSASGTAADFTVVWN